MAPILAEGVSRALKAISTHLPAHTKRLVLWSTLYCNMCDAQKLTKEQSDQLNSALTLCKDQGALKLPAQLCKFISRDLDACRAAAIHAFRGEQKKDDAAMDFLRSIPSWLRYASDAFMLNDFNTLLAIHRPGRMHRAVRAVA